MGERPILFSAPMVRAIINGRKTVTRRIVKDLPGNRGGPVGAHVLYWRRGEEDAARWCGCDGLGSLGWLICPYGDVGDRLWVKETYALHRIHEPTRPSNVLPTLLSDVAYRADGKFAPFDGDGFGRWRPSIHMPRWASRILLDVVSVRVERLHDITEDDARAEGVEADDDIPPGYASSHGYDTTTSRGAFANLWTEINGERATWPSNPWVWRVEFKRVDP